MEQYRPTSVNSTPIWDFSTKLYNAMPQDSGNYVISPISIRLMIAILHLGARDQTANEIQKVFCFNPDEEVFLRDYKSLLQKIQSPVLRTANTLFFDKRFDKLNDDFIKKSQQYLKALPEALNFKDPESSRTAINKWVKEKTQNSIKEIIPPGSIRADTNLIIVNGLYFKAAWKYPFPSESTSSLPFFNTPEKVVHVPMMNIKANFKYHSFQTLKAQVVLLPFENPGHFLLVILPSDKHGLEAVEKKLQWFPVRKMFDALRMQEVQVILPRFVVESSLNLKEPIEKLGAMRMFQKTANFSGLSTANDLHVSEILQKAFIEVNEEGATAAAATGAIFETLSFPFSVSFVANRPFMVVVIIEDTPIFYGRVKSF